MAKKINESRSSDMVWSPHDLAQATQGTWRNGILPQGEFLSIVTDSRQVSPDTFFVPLVGERFDAHDFLLEVITKGVRAVLVNRSFVGQLDVPMLEVDDTTVAYQAMARFHRNRMHSLTVIGITGSSGKTSTKDMLRATLCALVGEDKVLATQANLNNHIGVPLNLLNLTSHHRFAVIEMGTNHHGEIEVLAQTALPDAALITCIGASHLEYFKTQSEVAREKAHIFSANPCAKICVVPEKAEGLHHLLEAAQHGTVYQFGSGEFSAMQVIWKGGHLRGSRFILRSRISQTEAEVNWSVPGKHQAMNAAAVATVLEQLGFTLPAIANALSHTVLSGMRSLITEREGVAWVNDAYNANPESMRASIEWLAEFAQEEKLLLVLGDMRELGETTQSSHEAVIRQVQEQLPQAKTVWIGSAFQHALKNLNCVDATSFESSVQAIETVQNLAKESNIVFLKASRGTQVEVVEPGRQNEIH